MTQSTSIHLNIELPDFWLVGRTGSEEEGLAMHLSISVLLIDFCIPEPNQRPFGMLIKKGASDS